MKLRILVLAVFCFPVFLSGCGVTPGTLYKLPSGKEIKINGMNRMNFQNGQSAMVLNYETDIPISDMSDLQKEVAEVLEIFRYDVDNAGLKIAIIKPVHYEGTGFMKAGRGYGFVFEKQEDGIWRLSPNEKK